MTTNGTDQIHELLHMLDSDDLDERITAIQVLGDIGDAEALTALRQRMKPVNQELAALVTAIGKLKKKLNVK